MSNNKKAIILAFIMLSSLLGGSYGSYCIYRYNKTELLIENELEYDDSNKAFDDMFSVDENEIKIDVADKTAKKEIATGEELVDYLNKNKIDLVYIDRTWYSKEKRRIKVPKSIYKNDIYYVKEGETLNIKPNEETYEIITTPYDELLNHDVIKLLRYNKTYADDLKYSEIYYLS